MHKLIKDKDVTQGEEHITDNTDFVFSERSYLQSTSISFLL